MTLSEGEGSKAVGGTWQAASSVLRWRAKLRTTVSRRFHQIGAARAGWVAQATAASVVTAGARMLGVADEIQEHRALPLHRLTPMLLRP